MSIKSAPELPQEIWDLIADYLRPREPDWSSQALACLSKACRSYHKSANRALYSTPVLGFQNLSKLVDSCVIPSARPVSTMEYCQQIKALGFRSMFSSDGACTVLSARLPHLIHPTHFEILLQSADETCWNGSTGGWKGVTAHLAACETLVNMAPEDFTELTVRGPIWFARTCISRNVRGLECETLVDLRFSDTTTITQMSQIDVGAQMAFGDLLFRTGSLQVVASSILIKGKLAHQLSASVTSSCPSSEWRWECRTLGDGDWEVRTRDWTYDWTDDSEESEHET